MNSLLWISNLFRCHQIREFQPGLCDSADVRQNALALKTAALATTKSLFQTCSTLRKRLRCVEDFQPFLGKSCVLGFKLTDRPATWSRTSRCGIAYVSHISTWIPALPSLQFTHTHIHRPFFATLCQCPGS